MLLFDYGRFKEALRKVEEERYLALMADIEKVKAFVEKALTMCLECTATSAEVRYPGVSY